METDQQAAAEDRQGPAGVTLSFVAPVYNEGQCLREFHAQLTAEADKLGVAYEIILVNGGSTDDSLEVLRSLHEADDRVKYIDLSRNFGHQEALTAGYDHAGGEAVISLDADCQHPPELIAELVARWRQGYEVVYTVRKNSHGVSGLRRLMGGFFYRLFARLSGLDVADQADFRLLDRKVVDAIGRIREKARFVRGLVGWVGFRRVAVEYEARARHAGTSSFSAIKLARMAAAGIFSFSVVPLRLIGLAGLAMIAAAVLYAAGALAAWPFLGSARTANLVMLGVGMLGAQLAALGVLGEYIGRIYDETKDRPIYITREAVGFEPSAEQQEQAREVAGADEQPLPGTGRIRLFT